MEKLIELFKEYVDNHWTDTKGLEKEYGVIDDGQGFLYWTREYSYLTLISKSFWFIKWLVENEKIDINKYPQIEDYSDLECLLMYLAIQDEPIEFLIRILKNV